MGLTSPTQALQRRRPVPPFALFALVALAFPTALSAPARAGAAPDQAIENAEHRFRLPLSADWRPVAPAPGPEHIVASYANRATGQSLVVTRIDFPNIDAWRNKRPYFTAVEAGFRAASTDYRRLRKRQRKLGRVPVMDLRFERRRAGARETVDVRVIFFRTYSLTLLVASPDRPPRRVARATRAMLTGFRPFFGD